MVRSAVSAGLSKAASQIALSAATIILATGCVGAVAPDTNRPDGGAYFVDGSDADDIWSGAVGNSTASNSGGGSAWSEGTEEPNGENSAGTDDQGDGATDPTTDDAMSDDPTTDDGAPSEEPTTNHDVNNDEGTESSDSVDTEPELDCSASARGLSFSGLRRLTSSQLQLTLRSLLGTVYDDPGISGRMEGLPSDHFESPEGFTEAPPSGLVSALSEVAKQAAALGFADPDWRKQVTPCLEQGPPDADCIAEFITGFGARVLRREVEAQEHENYLEFFESAGGGEAGLRLLFRRMLQHPNLIYHFEFGTETPVDGRVQLTQFEVASRLAYEITDSPPDDALTAAARQGLLSDSAELLPYATRLLRTAAGRGKIRDFGRYYGALTPRSDPPPALAERHGLGDGHGLGEEMRQEALDFFSAIIGEQGTFSDLMLSTSAFPRSPQLATIFGVEADEGGGAIEAPMHLGFMHRPTLLASPGKRTSPILRGAHVRKLFLCTNLALPTDAAAVAAAKEVFESSETLSNRELVADATSGDACIGCHNLINPVGFLFEAYDQLGVPRSEEVVYDEDGNVVAQLAINTAVEGLYLEPRAPTSFENSIELAHALAESQAASSCFVRRALEFYRMRPVTSVKDACVLKEGQDLIGTTNLEELLASVVANDDLQWRTLEDEN